MTIIVDNAIITATACTRIQKIEPIQQLWSGYGQIFRAYLTGGDYSSVVVKHIQLPTLNEQSGIHPRGWNTPLSHQRKVQSYHVEVNWYQHYASMCDDNCRVPMCLWSEADETGLILVLEDLDDSGFSQRKDKATVNELKACLRWLAHFHAQFLQVEPEGLWACGSYWHLDTRPDELAALVDKPLQQAAPLIDLALKNCSFQTLIHGDAKLANFCFSDGGECVAAVDFQYVGRGCGMKDVVYLIGSCLQEHDCELLNESLLDIYFSTLKQALLNVDRGLNVDHIEQQWRPLFAVAWADFHRFLKGWSPSHWKINRYSERLTQTVIKQCLSEGANTQESSH